jgi:hypothetical protein
MDIRKSLRLIGLIFLFPGFSSVLLLSGCVERKLTINTEPQGAIVALNDEEIGISPVTIEFNWYGDYNIRIEKQGYETLNTHRKLKGPLHDRFPFDFFAEVLWPGRIIDEYEWSFRLSEYEPMDRDELLRASEAMKQKALLEIPPAKAEAEAAAAEQ